MKLDHEPSTVFHGHALQGHVEQNLTELSCISLYADAHANCPSPCLSEGVREWAWTVCTDAVLIYPDSSQTPRCVASYISGRCRTNSINSSKLLCETLITGILLQQGACLEACVRRQPRRRAGSLTGPGHKPRGPNSRRVAILGFVCVRRLDYFPHWIATWSDRSADNFSPHPHIRRRPYLNWPWAMFSPHPHIKETQLTWESLTMSEWAPGQESTGPSHLPLNSGQNFQMDSGLRLENWPRDSSMKKSGIPHSRRKLK